MEGLVCKSIRRFGTTVHVFEFDPKQYQSQVTYGQKGKKEKLSNIHHAWYRRNGYHEVAKINLGFFNPFGNTEHYGVFMHDGGFIEGNPKGKHVEAYLTKDGNFELGQLSLTKAKEIYKNVSWGGSLSYALVMNGKINLLGKEKYPHYKYNHPRTLIGQKSDKTMVLAVADGRSKNDLGLTGLESAKVMLELGCVNAVNADGGGSSQMMIRTNDGMETINNPSDGSERNIGSALLVFSKEPIVVKREIERIEVKAKRTDRKSIVIDIGHGEDTFNRTGGKGIVLPNGEKFEEHWFNADVGMELKKLLDHNEFGTILTQPPRDEEIPLSERTDFANRENVDLFVSIHANAGAEKAKGACCFYWYSAKDGEKLANIWAKKFAKTPVGTHGNGLHKAKPNSWTNLHVCRETRMTAVLFEHGFFTNEHDLKYILSGEYRKLCAEILAESICEFYGKEFDNPNKKIEEPKKEETIEAKPKPEPKQKVEIEKDWKVKLGKEAVDKLGEEGIIHSPETWYDKMREPSENWVMFELLTRILEKKEK